MPLADFVKDKKSFTWAGRAGTQGRPVRRGKRVGDGHSRILMHANLPPLPIVQSGNDGRFASNSIKLTTNYARSAIIHCRFFLQGEFLRRAIKLLPFAMPPAHDDLHEFPSCAAQRVSASGVLC